jgi:hypothetical protein
MRRSPFPLSSLVLWLALLAPLEGFAQAPEDAPPAASASPEESPAPPLVPAPEAAVFPRELETEDPNATFLIPRLILQPPAGFILGGVVGYASVVPLFLLSLPFCEGSIIDGSSDTCENLIYVGMATSAALGAAVGVTAIGKLLDGRGTFWATALGALLGTASAATIGFTIEPRTAVFAGVILAGSALGATTGYAISELYAPAPTRPAPRAGSGVSVIPVVSATRTGGLMGGLVGRF